MATTASLPTSLSRSSSSRKVSGGSPSAHSASVAKRLTSELMTLMMSPPRGVSAFPAEDGNMTFWKGRIDGAEGTAYEGQTYAVSLSFPTNYPYAPPTVKFLNTCFHPNVDLAGNICLDILKEAWSPSLSVSTVLVGPLPLSPLLRPLADPHATQISLQSLLGEPNNSSPLNCEAADLWDDQVAFKKELGKFYKPVEEDE